MKALIGLALATVVLNLLFGWLERTWPEHGGPRASHRETRTNLIYWFLDPLFGRLAVAGAIAVAVLLTLSRIPHHPAFVAGQPLWAQSLEALLVADFTGYWIHRAMHRLPSLWRFHSIHHSSEHMNWLASARVHPLETLIHRALTVIPLFFLGFPLPVIALYAPLVTLYAIFLHANVRWDYGIAGTLIASPRFHHWHHSSDPDAIDTNFAGFFPLWDHLFGTAHRPSRGGPARYGLAGAALPSSITAQLLLPFRKS